MFYFERKYSCKIFYNSSNIMFLEIKDSINLLSYQ